MKLSNKAYDALKWIVTIVLPASLTLLTAFNCAWGWNLPMEAISASVAAVMAFIGAVMGFSSALYNEEKKDDQ